MPIYEYRCENEHTFDVMQRMSDEPLTTCQVCEAPVQKVLSPVAVHFKGSGFYTTDYGKKGAGAGAGDAKKGESGGGSESSSDSGSSSSDSGSGSKESKPSGSGSDSAKASTKSS